MSIYCGNTLSEHLLATSHSDVTDRFVKVFTNLFLDTNGGLNGFREYNDLLSNPYSYHDDKISFGLYKYLYCVFYEIAIKNNSSKYAHNAVIMDIF